MQPQTRCRFPRAGRGSSIVAAALALTFLAGCGGIVDREAEKTLLARMGETSVTVFPAFVRDGRKARYDDEAAAALARTIEQKQLAEAMTSDARVPISGPWRRNEARMLRDSAADFATYLASQPIETEYALLPEYLIGGRGAVVGVHAYVLGPNGRIALAVLLNSHHEPFKRVNPKTMGDCTQLLSDVLSERLERSGAGQ